ncbi:MULTISPECIES: hypothetical protein [Cyanophyceae]|uniref:hypothetical protein n=1 Tax=Cyanophyceae TaxID=3028117 RepID=UPI0016882484|nr:hypothetical protein [Trichocoleus sp. FACHB-69]MBD1932163.1 hypothetical protein [Trichocoleus sp. FACHB-69]
MQRILLALKEGMQKRIFVLGLMALISLSGIFIFAAPSYAVLHSKDKLSSQEKIDRAYEYSEATGILEEEKQASENANKTFDFNEKANVKTVKSATEENSEPNLIEKAQDLIQKVTGND